MHELLVLQDSRSAGEFDQLLSDEITVATDKDLQDLSYGRVLYAVVGETVHPEPEGLLL